MTVFDFTDFREFIRFRISQQLYSATGRKKTNLANIARDLGYSSPSLLSMVLNGKRMPSDELCEVIARKWELTLKEREYFRLLVQLDKKRKHGDDTTDTVTQIRNLTGLKTAAVFKDSEFTTVREWHYLVIKLLVETPSFQEDPAWISRVLRKKITPSQAYQALEKLEQIGILQRDPVTNKLRPANQRTETTANVPSAAIRSHHQQMLHRSLEALEDIPVEDRVFNSLSLNVDRARLPEVKSQIQDFVRNIMHQYSATNVDSVYQLNMQFFEHTNFQSTESSKVGELNEQK